MLKKHFIPKRTANRKVTIFSFERFDKRRSAVVMHFFFCFFIRD
ncbi:hypothetical protein HMPREF9413_2253 [Paenibacillus sp. HGF7]|nr:hypothetical protein HMPREF9413_2253 [Paenibacillus sp. HGF7]